MPDRGTYSPQQFLDLWDAHTGPLPHGPFASDSELIAAMALQEEALIDFAQQHPFPATELAQLRRHRPAGGQEHDVYLPPKTRGKARVWKVTKPGRWGLIRATPREYLARLERLDANSQTSILVDGIAIEAGVPLLVTSMDFVDGTHLGVPACDALLREQGWEQMYDPDQMLSYQLRVDGTVMRDAHPKNFILTAAGRLVPIDVIFVGSARIDLHLEINPEGEEIWPEGEDADEEPQER